MGIIPRPCAERPGDSPSRFAVALIDDFRLSRLAENQPQCVFDRKFLVRVRFGTFYRARYSRAIRELCLS
jgi:hypothetical protein